MRIIWLSLVTTTLVIGCGAAPSLGGDECMRYAKALRDRMIECGQNADRTEAIYDASAKRCRSLVIANPLVDVNACFEELKADCQALFASFQPCHAFGLAAQ